jgi:hypothetical protein
VATGSVKESMNQFNNGKSWTSDSVMCGGGEGGRGSGSGRREVTQTIYTHMNKCKNNKKRRKQLLYNSIKK